MRGRPRRRFNLVANRLPHKLLTTVRVGRASVVAVLALAAFGQLVGSAYLFRPEMPDDDLILAAALLASGAVTLLAALWLNRRLAERPRETAALDARLTPARPNGPLTALGLVWFALLIAVNADRYGPFLAASMHFQMFLLVASLVTFAWGWSGGGLPFFTRRAQQAVRMVARADLWLMVLITLLAFGLRTWALDSEVHKFVDEIHFSTGVMRLWGGENARLFTPFSAIAAFPWIYPYAQYLTALTLGRDLESLRLVSAVLGTLSIPALYLLARTLLNRRVAVLAALLLATFPPHLHYSRIGLNNVADPLFGTLALALLALGLKHNRRRDFALGGVALGMTAYFYEGGRLLFPPLALLALAGLTLVRPKLVRARWRGLLAAGFAALVVMLPLYTTLLAQGDPLIARFKTVGLGGSYWLRVIQAGAQQSAAQQVLRPFLMYVHQPETALFYGGNQPLLLAPLVPFFFIGVTLLVWRWRTAGALALLWLLLTSGGNMLMTESAISARYVVAFPALMLVTAVGIEGLLALTWFREFPPRWQAATVGLLALALALIDVGYYFGPHLSLYNRQIRPFVDSEDAMFRAANLSAATQTHVISDNAQEWQYLSGILGYLADGHSMDTLTRVQVTPEYVLGLSPYFNHAFFIEQDDALTLNSLRRYFGDMLEGPYYSPYNVPQDKQLALYYLPARPIPAG
jgi:hypothetical protein